MTIVVNGMDTVVNEETKLDAFLSRRGLRPTQVVVELNGDVVPRNDITNIVLRTGDRLEVIVPVAGG